MAPDDKAKTQHKVDIIEKSLLGSSFSYRDEPKPTGSATAQELAETEED